jgi:hypothetical protein
MNKRESILVILFLSFFISVISAQPNKEADEIKNTLTVIFDLSKADDFESTAKYIVYSGDDKGRKFVDTYNYKERREAKDVKRIAKKIKALLDITDKYNFIDFKSETRDANKVYIQMVNFESSGQQLTTKFEFLKVGDKYLLLNVK